MKIVTPLVTLAALTGGASAAADRENARSKKRTIFHKVDGDDAVDKTDRRRRQSGLHKMEKATRVDASHIIEQSLERYRVMKKSRVEGAASVEDEARREANPESSGSAGEESPGDSTLLRSAGNAHRWEARPAPASAPDVSIPLTAPTHYRRPGEAAKDRRHDQAHDFALVKKRRGRRGVDVDRADGRRTTGKRRTRREAAEPEARPRPRRVAPSGKDDERRRIMRPESAKPGPLPPQEERDLKKSKKHSKSSKSKGGKGSSNEDKCLVRLTNLTKEQWFSDVFWMVHSDKVEEPLWRFGSPVFSDLASLAQDGDADDLVDFYEDNDQGVLEVDSERGPIMEGESLTFDIPTQGSYDLFTMASSFLFSNDGFVSIDAGDIRDGATWFLWGLDAGVEGNVQLCWTVPATSADFPSNAGCSDVKESVADENDNRFPGEGFVHVHPGVHDFDGRSDVNDFLEFTCRELDADSFVEYFREIGFDDDGLLYDDDRGRNERDDGSFLDFVEDNDDEFAGLFIFGLAVEAGSFRKFCNELDDINSFLIDTFTTLEPQIFDFRTPMMRVEMNC